jgi:predicted Zn-dependent protease
MTRATLSSTAAGRASLRSTGVLPVRAAIGCLLLLCVTCLAGPASTQLIKIPDRLKTAIDKGQKAVDETQFTTAQEQAIGKEVAAKLINYLGVYDNPKLASYVRMVGQAVAMQSERQDISYHFELLNSGDVNAFACPGGYILVTRGLLETVTSEAQLAGVLGHEVGHVTAKHVIKALQRAKAIQMGVKETDAYNPGSKYLGNIADNVLIRIVDNGLDPGDEFDADQRGVQYAYAAGYRPDGLGMFLDKFMQLAGQSETKTAWLSHTHPPAMDRVQRMANLIVGKKMELDARAELADRYQAARQQ